MEGVIGYTTLFAGSFEPKSWAYCRGQLISIASNTALFSILGTSYGGDGKVTFGLPNLAGRTVVGVGQGPGLSPYSIGQMSGAETATLNQSQMPAHIHPISIVAQNLASASPADKNTAQDHVYGADNAGGFPYSTAGFQNMGALQGALQTAPVGNNQAFNILRPILGLNYIICMRGVFPARN